jgi:site-specific DNA recombinase
MGSKALIATRLSHFTDESTSIERQGEQGEATAKARGEEVVYVAQDVDVSGAVSPFQRADLGPWLTDPDKIAQWDTLIVAKLDRLSRSLIDFAGLLKWCQAHGKVIVSVSESLDFGTAAGRLMAQILMMFAEFERERMSERRADAAVKIRSNGHYGGGSTAYGYRTIKVNNHHELEPDPAQVAVVEQIAADVIAGKSLNSIAQALNASGTPAAQGGRWHGSTLGLMMRNPALKGFVMHDGTAVRGDDGMPVRRAAVLDDATWDAVQCKLGAMGKANRQDGSPYLSVIVCGRCGAQLYLSQWLSNGKRRAYYRHAGNQCPVKNINADRLEMIMDLRIKQELGATRVMEPIKHPAEDHSAELAQVEQAMSEIEAQVVAGLPAASATRMLTSLEARRATLAALPQREAWTEYRDGGSFSDRWADLDADADRGALLRKMGVRIAVSREGRKLVVTVKQSTPAAVAADQPAG